MLNKTVLSASLVLLLLALNFDSSKSAPIPAIDDEYVVLLPTRQSQNGPDLAEVTFSGPQSLVIRGSLSSVKSRYAGAIVAKNDIVSAAVMSNDDRQGENASSPLLNWNLAVVARSANPDVYLVPEKQGQGVDVYILDTGIDIGNPMFSGQATRGASFVKRSETLSGHGTHVAGIVKSVAPLVNIIDVRVLESDNSGSVAQVVDGINWVINRVAQTRRPSVINLSLGAPKNEALNGAIKMAHERGIYVVAAAGNQAQDACQFSPSSAEGALSVGSLQFDGFKISSFSNFGSCVDIVAPGSQVTSAWVDGKTMSLSGTSMAAPHVAAIAAIVLAQPETATQMQSVQVGYQIIKEIAVSSPGLGELRGSPALVAFNGRSTNCQLNRKDMAVCQGIVAA